MEVTGGQAVVDALEAEGVKVVFGIPGDHTLPLYDGLFHRPSIRHILTRHEQGAAFMAQGYAMTSGKVGVCCATTGPGAFNAVTPLGEAYGDSARVLLIASEVASDHIGKAKGAYHESQDQLGVLQRVTGWAAQANSVREIPQLIHEAFVRMQSGRPRPTAIQVPVDVLKATDDVGPLPAAQPRCDKADAAAVRKAVQLLVQAERPIIWAGGGVNISGANEKLRLVAELLSAPVVTTAQGKGAIPEDRPLALGNWASQARVTDLIRGADVLLAVGTRFPQLQTNRWMMSLPDSIVQIDVDASQIGKNYPAAIGLVGDANAVLEQLLTELRARPPMPKTGVADNVREIRDSVTTELRSEYGPEAEMVDIIRSKLDRDVILFTDTAAGTSWLRTLLPVRTPRSFFSAGGFSTLGFAVPSAIGAKVAFPDRQVIAACGDGSFMFTCQELGTAIQDNIPVTVILFNNLAHQLIKDHQAKDYGARYIGADLVQPDFVRFAESFGAVGLRVERLDQLEPALDRALGAKKPSLIEVTMPIRHPKPTKGRIAAGVER